jgi:hypothetical protein
LVSLLLFVPPLFAPSEMLKRIDVNHVNTKRGKFVKQGWVLQEGDI